MATTTTRIRDISLVCVPTPDQDESIGFYESLGFEKRTGVDVDAEVSRMGDPVPPLFWFRDPTGHVLMVVEQP